MCQRALTLILVVVFLGCSPFANRQEWRKDASLNSRTGNKSAAKKSGWKRSKEAEAKPFTPLPQIVLVQPEWLEQTCEVHVRSEDPDQKQWYEGKLISADDKGIVIERPRSHGLQQKRHPILGAWFSKSIHGGQQLEENVTIPREQVESIRPLVLTP